MAKTCLFCGKRSYGDYCFQHKPRKPIKQISDKTLEQTKITAKKWWKLNPPDKDGYWYCYLQISPLCPIKLTADTVTREHVIPKVKAPERKYDVTNIRPACKYCNKIKGSRTLETLAKIYPHLEKYTVL